ncbi:DNA alkylation repair protein [Gordonia sihwensis]|uniref:DNA alkylation repair protein n=1 Tax=Gordonia sihwensis TaxID=173559 RepID=UPI001C92D7C2|nr:DNA alkylation repair protein [Gordonia sihwensis]MBY4570068.1 DNA alkylation repair protein [Gordonia sihwensis]
MNADSGASEIVSAVEALGDPERAASSQRFFKTGPGQYGEGDRFAGVPVPKLRALARSLRGLPRSVIVDLLGDRTHEVRHLALLILADNYSRESVDPERWVDVYRDAVRGGRVDNWDLVDVSAYAILGDRCLRSGDWSELLEWAASDDLWQRRAGIVATFAFIRAGRWEQLEAVAPLVIDDRRDLIQKAFGWMLREAGKRADEQTLLRYLEVNASSMGRTALSYAVERLSTERRAHFRSL